MFIYIITNTITQEFYVGQTTKTLRRRFSVHKCNARYGVDTHLYRAMRKYGEENFSIKCVESLDDETKLNERERHFIAEMKPHYNMNEGGASGNSMSPKHSEAMRKYHTNKPRESYATYGMLGKKQPLEARLKTAAAKHKPCICKGLYFESVLAACSHFEIGRTTFFRWKQKGLAEVL